MILFADHSHRFCPPEVSLKKCSETERAEIGLSLPFFYTLHFIKSQKDDAPFQDELMGQIQPRNYGVRVKACRCALSLAAC